MAIMTQIQLQTQALVLFATIAFTSSQADWKPIIGPGTALKAQPSLHYPSAILSGLNGPSSSSKSSITFNGQTISTSIHNAGPSLSVTPDLSAHVDVDVEDKARFLDYSKYLTGFFGPTAIQVSSHFGHRIENKAIDPSKHF